MLDGTRVRALAAIVAMHSIPPPKGGASANEVSRGGEL